MFDFLTYPFMQRALIAGFMVAILLGWMGVYVISRHLSFIGSGIAHASLAAIAFAILLGLAPLPTALVFAVILALLLFYLQEKTNVSQDTAIGMLFAVGMAVGIILLQFTEGYVPSLVSFLFGSILAVKNSDLITVLVVGVVVLALLWRYRRALAFVTVDAEGAQLSGIPRRRMEVLLYILTAVTVVLSLKVVGIVLVSALLVIPSAIGKTLAHSFSSFQWIAIVSSVLTVLLGLLFSYILDLPSGASIVLVGALGFTGLRIVTFFSR